MTARAAAFKLMTIGIESSAYNGLNEHNIVAGRKKKKKVAVILSFTGCNPGMVSAAKFLRDQGVYVVGMGGGAGEELRSCCNLHGKTDYEYGGDHFHHISQLYSGCDLRFSDGG